MPGEAVGLLDGLQRIEGLGTKTESLLVSEPSIVEIDELRPLIAEGQEKGFLTVEQITTCLEEVEVTKEQIADLHHYLEEKGIDILGAVASPDSGGRFSRETPAEATGREPPERPKFNLALEPSLDSLRLYLRSIGRVQLLTADREVAL